MSPEPVLETSLLYGGFRKYTPRAPSQLMSIFQQWERKGRTHKTTAHNGLIRTKLFIPSNTKRCSGCLQIPVKIILLAVLNIFKYLHSHALANWSSNNCSLSYIEFHIMNLTTRHTDHKTQSNKMVHVTSSRVVRIPLQSGHTGIDSSPGNGLH
jgi:hypothetical protein